ncbi:DUF3618 domain-containing protein [Krasilnikovia sp. M28-CT-15]|uniref:DUF3618 domain-containing protein n=1 Tax=Krasilnikovia sp. M28-CT-15 TaxID=3373540 RepID=UPI003876581E
MTTSYTSGGLRTSHTPAGSPEHIRADIEQNRADLDGTVTALTGTVEPGTRMRGALSRMKTRTASGVSRLRAQAPRRARQAVRNPAVPATVGGLALAGAVAAVLLGRRAAKSRSARKRWLPGILHR